MGKKCCFTGYRPQKLSYLKEESSEAYQRLYRLLTKQIRAAIDEGYDYFISGFAEGVDLIAAEIVLHLKNDGFDIQLEAALPAMNQSEYWDDYQKGIYFVLLDKADFRKCVDHKMTKYSCLKRDEYMVDQADLVIAVFDGKKGGTAYTLNYAKDKNRNIWIIDPLQYTVKKEEGLF
jgi:uncharacterized phage-like protein YoqJ